MKGYKIKLKDFRRTMLLKTNSKARNNKSTPSIPQTPKAEICSNIRAESSFLNLNNNINLARPNYNFFSGDTKDKANLALPAY